MQRQQLMADNILARCQRRGEFEGVRLIGDERVTRPGAVREFPGMRDFEPYGGGAGGVVFARAGAFGEVGEGWAVVLYVGVSTGGIKKNTVGELTESGQVVHCREIVSPAFTGAVRGAGADPEFCQPLQVMSMEARSSTGPLPGIFRTMRSGGVG